MGDELASFQRNGHNGDEFSDEDIDFTPQNGYVEPEGMEYEEVGQGRKLKNPKKGKQQPALMGKIAAAGSAIKKARLPTPMELKEGYLNSAFHKSLHQPLIVKSKVEKADVRVARQALTQEKSPTALGNINSVSDIPIPKVFASKPAEDGEVPAEAKPMPRNMDEWGQAAYNTLPKSFREQNIVTSVKENLDPEELARNQELTRSKTPAELAQIHSLSEFPVPENIKKFLTSERKRQKSRNFKSKKRHSVTEAEGPPEPFSLYSTLPRSMRETKLVTNVKVEEDEEVLRARQELVQTRTPAQLSAITSISDLPVPSKLTKMMGSRESSAHGPRPASTAASVAGEKQTSRTPSKMNVNDMYSTLPKSLTMELAVKTKINDPAVVEERRKLTAEHTPMELGNIGSLADFPIPTPISNLFNKPAADTPEKPKRKPKNKEEEKEKERSAKQEEKRKKKEEKKMEEKAKVEKQKEMKRLKLEEKEQKRKEEAEIKKLQKQEEERLKQRQEEERKKRVEEEKREKREKEQKLEEERKAKIEKDKIERLKKEEEEKALQKKQEEERMKMKEEKEEEKRKQKQLEEERKQLREKEKQEEKERKALAKIEKDRQAKELKALIDAQRAEKEIPETDVEYADEEDTRVTSSVRHPSVIEEEKEPPATPERSRSSIEPEYEPVGAAGPSTPEMALHRLPGADDDKYVSVVGRDELASFQRNGHNGDEFGDEDIDFTPQNGYVEPEGMEYEEVGQGRKLKNPKKGKQQPALMGKIAAAGSAIKKARLPTPMELKEGYLNSAFHKSLHQPLIVKSKVEKEDVRVARQALTQEKSPTALANINSVS